MGRKKSSTEKNLEAAALDTSAATRKPRKKQEVLPEVKALLEQASATVQAAKVLQKNGKVASRVAAMIRQSGANQLVVIHAVARELGIHVEWTASATPREPDVTLPSEPSVQDGEVIQ